MQHIIQSVLIGRNNLNYNVLSFADILDKVAEIVSVPFSPNVLQEN